MVNGQGAAGEGRRRGWWLTGLAAIVMLIAAVCFRFAGADIHVSDEPATSRNTFAPARGAAGSARVAGQPFTGPRDVGRDHGSTAVSRTPRVLPGDDYDAIVRRFGPLQSTDETALVMVYRANTICASRVVRRPSMAKSPVSRPTREWIASFCKGRVTEGERAIYEKLLDETFERRHEKWPDMPEEEEDAKIFDLALESNALLDSELVADLVTMSAMSRWGFAADEVAGTPYESRLGTYQRIALQSLECDRIGGCEPRGFTSMWLCVTEMQCVEGKGAYEQWNDELTAPEVAIVDRIRDRIREERSRRQSARANAAGP